jgi:hypothetical protein
MAELAFEYMCLALEGTGTKGTVVDPPTHFLNMAGTITPKAQLYRPLESSGLLAEFTRSKIVKEWTEWQGAGPADVYTLPLLLEMAVKGGGTKATPAGATNSRTWTYSPTQNADDLLSATMYFGDPNVQAFQAPYCMCDEIVISANAAAADAVTMSAKGQGRAFAKDAPNSLPTRLTAPLLAATDLQLYIDTSSAIGSTEITGRVVSADITIPSGVAYKWLGSGPTGGTNFTRHGRKKRHVTLKVVFELLDMTQYDLWKAASVLKTRLKLNGPIIETTFRHYIQFDVYGPFADLAWGELEGANRTIELTIQSEYNATATTDFSIVVQNDRDTL